ncbi:MAG: hypothetical protein ACLQVD_20275 [Capsulimonadaceae bacterium]
MTPLVLGELAASLLLGGLAFAWITRRCSLRRANYSGDMIPSMGGIALLVAGDFYYSCRWLGDGIGSRMPAAFLLTTLAFGVLGALDDLYGDRSVGGFRGHLAALRRGRLTTGAAKLIGGGLAALAAGFLLYWPSPGRAVLAAAVIALSANTVNLLDLRPGRCLSGVLAGCIPIAVLLVRHGDPNAILFWFVFVAAVALYPLDASATLMLGDTGANAFGALLGLSVALFIPAAWQAAGVIAMVVFQAWCEGHSLSSVIEANPLLRSIDRKIGVRR